MKKTLGIDYSEKHRHKKTPALNELKEAQKEVYKGQRNIEKWR